MTASEAPRPRRVRRPGADLDALIARARAEVALRRGGRRYLADLDAAEGEGGVWWVLGRPTIGFALIRERRLIALYVAPEARREGLGRQLLDAATRGRSGARDGLALPGDRATKSLFESAGWRARLLTMSAE